MLETKFTVARCSAGKNFPGGIRLSWVHSCFAKTTTFTLEMEGGGWTGVGFIEAARYDPADKSRAHSQASLAHARSFPVKGAETFQFAADNGFSHGLALGYRAPGVGPTSEVSLTARSLCRRPSARCP